MPARKKATPAPAPAAAAPPPEAAPAPGKAKGAEVKLSAAKGRPMLQWVGKRPLRSVTAFPAQHAETFDPAASGLPGGQLFYGDNKEVLAHLLTAGFRGKVDLIYIDPPFDSGADYVRKVTLRGRSALAGKEFEAEGASLGEQVPVHRHLGERQLPAVHVRALHFVEGTLSDTGAIYCHCDYRKIHHLRCLMDEVFGADSHMNQLVWMFSTRSAIKSTWKRTHHDILFYKRHDDPVFNWDDELVMEPLSASTIAKYKLRDENGTPYRLNGRNIKGSPIRSAKDVDRKYEETNPEWVVRDLLREGKSASDYFFIDIENQASKSRTDYPTQKPGELLAKLISASYPAR